MALRREDLKLILDDPREFIPLLSIVDPDGHVIPFDQPFPEQVELVDALMRYREVYILKPRQIGCSTVVRAYNFWYGYTCPDPIRELIVSHEADSTEKMHRANREFLSSLVRLDRRFERPLKASNRKELIFDDTGAMFRCLTAGGTGLGKSWTFQRGHFTEVGSWPENLASPLWASLRATMHPGPHYQLVAESTGHGPGTFWADLVERADRSDTAKVVFFKWSEHPQYQLPPPPNFERTDEEQRLADLHDLTNPQLYWRRKKIAELPSTTEFRHNYPLTKADAFMSESGSYFDADRLETMLARAERDQRERRYPIAERNGLRVYKLPEPGLRYVAGVDSASGVGEDFATINVFSEDYEQVAVYHSNRAKPEELAEYAAEVGNAYYRALILAEGRQGAQGGVTLYRLRQLGYRNLWMDENGKEWDTNSASKMRSYSHARRMLNEHGLLLHDPLTIRELLSIQQDESTDRIAAPKGKHDDLAITVVFACWALRNLTALRTITIAARQAATDYLAALPPTPY